MSDACGLALDAMDSLRGAPLPGRVRAKSGRLGGPVIERSDGRPSPSWSTRSLGGSSKRRAMGSQRFEPILRRFLTRTFDKPQR